MLYFFLLLGSLFLFFGFVGLTLVEAKTGVRIFSVLRTRFDHTSSRILYVCTHVDLAAFFFRVSSDAFSASVHAITHASLTLVRTLERTLTRAVRHIRAKNGHAPVLPPKETSRFVRTISYFKQTLRRSRKTTVVEGATITDDKVV
jgi:hypothetical protein